MESPGATSEEQAEGGTVDDVSMADATGDDTVGDLGRADPDLDEGEDDRGGAEDGEDVEDGEDEGEDPLGDLTVPLTGGIIGEALPGCLVQMPAVMPVVLRRGVVRGCHTQWCLHLLSLLACSFL